MKRRGYMRTKNELYKLFLTFLLILTLTSVASASIMFDSGNTIIIDDIIEDDVYLVGETLIVSGEVQGDVVATGGTVKITGNITGDLIAAAGDVIITGNVNDDVRVASGTFELTGNVGDDLLVTSGMVKTTENATVGGDATIRSGDAELAGQFDGGLDVSAGEIDIIGTIEGDAELETSDLSLRPDSQIKGDLKYTSPRQINIPTGVVGEDITFDDNRRDREPSATDSLFDIFSLIGTLAYYLFLFTIGAMMILIFPEQSKAIADHIKKEPVKDIFVGLLALAGALLGIFMLSIIIIGLPLALLLFALLIFVLITAKIYTAMLLGDVMFEKLGIQHGQWTELAAGLLLLLVLTSLPWVGGLISIIATLAAMGSMYFALKY